MAAVFKTGAGRVLTTITTAQLRQLAGWEPNQQVVEVDLETMTETTLADDAVVTLTPGRGFAKKIRFKRG